MYNAYKENSLRLNQDLCNGCGMCMQVCPHAVFALENKRAFIQYPENCMECGACQKNCPVNAISVESGVGCATAMMYAALTGKKEPACGCSGSGGCCNNSCG